MVEWKQNIPCSFYRYLVKHMTVQFTHKPANRYITFLNSKVQSINERKFPKAEFTAMQLSIQVIMELNQISINCNAKVTRVPIADASI